MGFEKKVHKKHKSHYNEHVSEERYSEEAKKWIDEATVDSWRHERMHRCIDPILEEDKGKKWITIGDGRFGREAKRINNKGGEALPTDISTHLLKEAKDKGFIDKFAEENAESLSFEDGSFDYAYCKETIHHLPRPYKGIYEMLRVSRKGIIICEPNDFLVTDYKLRGKYRAAFMMPTFLWTLRVVAPGLAKRIIEPVFEDSGNFAYRLSRREMEKVALGMNIKSIAIKGINDHYVEGVERERMGEGGGTEKYIKIMIKIQNILTALGIMDYRVLNFALFKTEIPNTLQSRLIDEGWKVKSISQNPNY